MIASAAVTTGLFVLGGVVVGGLVTGGVNYGLEWRRERASGRVALRLIDVELLIAAATGDGILDDGRWSSWNFERAHRAWDEYGADAARVLSNDDWIKVSLGFYGIDLVERDLARLPTGASLDSSGLRLLGETRRDLYAGANAIRRHLGMPQVVPKPRPTRT